MEIFYSWVMLKTEVERGFRRGRVAYRGLYPEKKREGVKSPFDSSQIAASSASQKF